MRYWYYLVAGQPKGPLTEEVLLKLFESDSLPATTLVWREGFTEWQEAGATENLLSLSSSRPPAPPRVLPPPPLHNFIPSGLQARPWVRYWARTIDLMLFSVLVGVLLALVYPAALEINALALAVTIVFLYVFIEPFMLSSWGTTPGKALLNIRLRRIDGTRLNYIDALSRSFNVWIRGCGLGLPIVGILTHITGYTKLSKYGITSWDKDGAFRIDHKILGPGRVIACVATFAAFSFLIRMGELKYARILVVRIQAPLETPIFHHENRQQIDGDPYGDLTVQAGKNRGLPWQSDEVKELNFFGQVVPYEVFCQVEGGEALARLMARQRAGLREFTEALSSGSGLDFVPYAGDLASLGAPFGNTADVFAIMQRIRRDGADKLSTQDLVTAKLYVEELKRQTQQTRAAFVVSCLKRTPASAMEFATSGLFFKQIPAIVKSFANHGTRRFSGQVY